MLGILREGEISRLNLNKTSVGGPSADLNQIPIVVGKEEVQRVLKETAEPVEA